MKEKWKTVTLLIIFVVITATVTFVVTMQLIPVSDDIEKPNPYASILEQSANYSSAVNALLNETSAALQTYYSTGNATHIVHAGRYLTVAKNVQREYHKWYAFNVFKEIDDHDIDAQIFDDIFNLEDAIALYLDAVLTAQKTVS